MSFVSPAEGRVTSHWGPRERHPVTGVRGFHRGIDIAPPVPGQRGCPVYACYGGTVRAVRTGRRNGDRTPNPITGTWNTGNYVLIDGPGGGSEWYGHLETIRVAPGDRVKAGDLLGTMGDSGNVSGVHLHLEMWNGRTQGGGLKGGNTRDPRIDFKRHGVTPGSRPVFPKAPVGPLPSPDKTPVTPIRTPWEELLAMFDSKKDFEDFIKKTVSSTVRYELGQAHARQNEQLNRAWLRDMEAERPRIAASVRQHVLGDVHPKGPGSDVRGLLVEGWRDDQIIKAAVDEIRAALTNDSQEA